MANVAPLLEVALEGEVQEGPVRGRELHGCGQPALNDGQIAGRLEPIQVVHVGPDVDSVGHGEARRIDAWTGDDDEAEVGRRVPREREALEHPVQERRADAGAADAGHDHTLSGREAELVS